MRCQKLELYNKYIYVNLFKNNKIVNCVNKN